jgi:molecular chaperone DnaJ
MYGGPPGHLFVEVRVEQDPRFERRDFDLYTVAQVPYPVAALGGALRVSSLEGEVEIAVPPGSQHDDIVTVKGHGIPQLNGKGRGDLHAVVRLTVPKNITTQERELLQQLLLLQPGTA